MKGISFCTAIQNRLWQLQQTLPHNLKFTIAGSIEICILVYNDEDTYSWLSQNFKAELSDGRLKVKHHVDGREWEFGYVKSLSHELGTRRVLFNLDADNYIDGTVDTLLDLNDHEVVTPKSDYPDMGDGRIGRIGLTRKRYEMIGGYDHGTGSRQDGLLIYKAAISGCKVIQLPCPVKPISNLK
jgi:hypothetical protein